VEEYIYHPSNKPKILNIDAVLKIFRSFKSTFQPVIEEYEKWTSKAYLKN